MAQESIWRLIPEFSNYEINQFGIVRNKNTGHIKPLYGNCVKLYNNNNKPYNFSVHKLLHQIFPEFQQDLSDFIEIPNIPNYLINKSGDIWSIRHNKIMKTCINKEGYVTIELNTKGYRLHRLLGLNFIPNPENKPEIDHIDRNKQNNSLENLRWVTGSENSLNRSYKTEHHNIIINKSGSYKVQIRRNKKTITKTFKDFLDAIKFRDEIINLK